MNPLPSKILRSGLTAIAPWVQLFGALLVVVLVSFYAAGHSELGNQISMGESPAFAWIKIHIPVCLWIGLAFLIFAFGLQHLAIRLNQQPFGRGMKTLA